MKKSADVGDVINILILMVLALGIGVYLVFTTVVISKDGVGFIEYAKNLGSEPVKTMLKEDQHPGYPALILFAYKISRIFCSTSSVWSWILCSQGITLLFRILAMAVLYFVGKKLIGSRSSFWAILILILLPKPAVYGSDVLSDWPSVFFLAAGLFFLLFAAETGKWWFFGLAGLAGGMGYLIRPECAQIVTIGVSWLFVQLFFIKNRLNIVKTISAIALLLIIFLLVAGPYMKLKGAVFPKKDVGRFAVNLQTFEKPVNQKTNIGNQTLQSNAAILISGFVPLNIAESIKKLIENLADLFMWFFFPAALTGFYYWYKNRKLYEPEKFFVAVFFALNISLMIWLYCKNGYMSGRHVLPFVSLLVLYVPEGLLVWASWLHRQFAKKQQCFATQLNERFLFFALLIMGVTICLPKLLISLHYDKKYFLQASMWLAQNTPENDVIAVPDIRISFYAQRKGLSYESEQQLPAEAKYVVQIIKKKNNADILLSRSGQKVYEYFDRKKPETGIAIFRNL